MGRWIVISLVIVIILLISGYIYFYSPFRTGGQLESCIKSGWDTNPCIKERINICDHFKDYFQNGELDVKGNQEECVVELKGRIKYAPKEEYSSSDLSAKCIGPSESISDSYLLIVDMRGGGDNQEVVNNLKNYCSGSLMDAQFHTVMSYDLEYFQGIAITEKNINMCGELMLFADKTSCIKNYLLEYGGEEVCETLKDNTLRDWCLAEVAIIKKDSLLCDGLKFSDYCYSELAVLLLDENLCEKTSSYVKKDCFSWIAVVKSDPSLCIVDGCYSLLAVNELDDSYCEMIKTVDSYNQKERCVEDVKELKADPSLCYSPGSGVEKICSYPDPKYSSGRIVMIK